jgi:hypothetical protein
VLKRRLEEAIHCAMNPHHGAPFHHGDKYFHNSGLQTPSVLYVKVNHNKNHMSSFLA